MQKKRLAILGSTGSIGTQALGVVRANPDVFSVEVLTGGKNAGLLVKQALEFLPDTVVIEDAGKIGYLKSQLQNTGIKVFAGGAAIEQIVQMPSIDTVLTAIVGYAGLASTLSAIKAGKQIALANKETMVVAGELITVLAKKHGVNILPVDSEHSAVFQCLTGESANPVEKIYLTASGGPFRGKDLTYLASAGKAEALKHPNWEMGAKITIDSATLMNKGLEVIEAKWLFQLQPEQIEVIVHPQSVIHSIVQFLDGSMKAQMGLPDMRLPIQYALAFPIRLPSAFKRFSFTEFPTLSFEKPDTTTFPCLELAYYALKKGGNMACTLNAANEIAVQAFLEDKISFIEIASVIEKSIEKIPHLIAPTYEDYVNTDKETRKFAAEVISINT